MSNQAEKKLFNNDQIIRVVGAVFLIGSAWARLEYKMDAATLEQKNMLEKYIVSNDKDKDMLNYQLSELRDQVDVNTLTIKTITDFIKPERPEIKGSKKYEKR